MPSAKKQDKFTLVSELAKRRGFFWPSFEIYGGVGGFYTYGPLGALLKRRIEDKFRDFFIRRFGFFEIESSVIMPEKVFEASGHVEHFQEPMVECLKCKRKFRADHLLEEFAGMSSMETEKLSLKEIRKIIVEQNIRCPDCGGEFGEPKNFLTMFATTIGPYSDAVGYGRPEAAQGIFVEFKRLYELCRERLPFGVVQIGHALRNEISPRQGLMRLREFTIIDLEFFFDPEDTRCTPLKEVENETLRFLLAETKLKGSEEITELTVKEALEKGYVKVDWQAFFMVLAKKFMASLGVPPEKQRFIEKLDWEKAHYAVQSFDQEVYLDRWGWTEVSGHAYRADYDLKQHMKFSRVDMRIFKPTEKPIEKEEVKITPIPAKIGPVFKKDAAKIIELLSKTDVKAVERSFSTKGFYMLKGFKILPEHVEITRRKLVERGKRFLPHVVEPSFGSDRLFYVALEYAYQVKENRVVLRFPRDIAPVQVGVYPLVNRDGLPEKAMEVHRMLLNEGFYSEYDESGSIGRRYARADEIGVPLGITIDYQTLEDGTVTIRDRDSWKQVRNRIKALPELLHRYFRYKIDFKDLGEPIET